MSRFRRRGAEAGRRFTGIVVAFCSGESVQFRSEFEVGRERELGSDEAPRLARQNHPVFVEAHGLRSGRKACAGAACEGQMGAREPSRAGRDEEIALRIIAVGRAPEHRAGQAPPTPLAGV